MCWPASPGRPGSLVGASRGLRRRSAALALALPISLGQALVPAQAATPALDAEAVQTVAQAQRRCDGAATAIQLPDRVTAAPGHAGPLRCSYRFTLGHPGRGLGLFIPGLAAHARVSINGQVLVDTLASLPQPVPRGADRIVLLSIPDAVWQPGANALQIDAAGPRSLALSRLQLGPYALVQQRHRARLLASVVGPAWWRRWWARWACACC